MPLAEQTLNGYRAYDESAIDRIRFIQQARSPQDPSHPGPHTSRQHARQAMDRHAATRTPRPHHHLEPAATPVTSPA